MPSGTIPFRAALIPLEHPTIELELVQEEDDEAGAYPSEVCVIIPSSNRAACLFAAIEYPVGCCRGVSVKTTIDTGNLTNTGVAISEQRDCGIPRASLEEY